MSKEKFAQERKTEKEKAGQESEQEIHDFYQEQEDGAEISEQKESIPDELLDTDRFLEMYGEDFADEIYQWYKKAIERRDREPLEEYRFSDHFFGKERRQRNYMFGDYQRGYLLGEYRDGVFIPTHFAPRSLRKGYELIKELGSGQLPAVMLITEDIAKTLQKMPAWKIEDLEIPRSFRGEDVKKKIAHNQFPDVEEKLQKLATKYFKIEN